ncbi:ParM/StbA family protein [Tolypothrix sp. FACHB-123]|uniref:ParM/StbA family protein n=1 Tax=Tolypothrix sp. FACHB-123 TaxID=2692868 RepID=UPI0016889BF2|nr:ParM/StbA family protein [Tolypothrix sp. FACHB-123]MBD2354795.1 ParM/StbA family protein [Tolypothrix sp. FACHB-123]
MGKMTQRRNKSSPELILALDFGGSATKGVYSTLDMMITKSLLMEPEVVKISPDSTTGETLGATDPENAAWIRYTGQTLAVGYLAKTKYYGNEGLKELKYERAVAKTLAAIWVTSQKLKLGAKFRVALVCLLPPGEFENKESFQQQLKAALADFTTPTGRMRVELFEFKCLPEGAGIYLAYQKQQGKTITTKAILHRSHSVIAFVMVGYRNASVLIAERGIIAADGKTSDLGMIRLLEKVVARTSGQTTSQLAPAIVAAGSDISGTPFLRLLRSANNANKQQELMQIQQAVKLARNEYAAVLTSWLDQVISRNQITEILFCGGTADYMKRELNSHYPGIPCLWGVGADIPSEVDRFGLGSRLADVYSVFLYFWEKVNYGRTN